MQHIFDQLGINEENGLYIFAKKLYKNILSKRIEKILEEKLHPEAFFIFDKKILILFYKNIPSNQRKNIFKNCWNFGEAPIIIIEDHGSLEIFNGFHYIVEKKSLQKISTETNQLNYISIINGDFFQNASKDFEQKDRVDYHLLRNIKDARELLINNCLDISTANALIGRIIFIRYLIDREVKLKFENNYRALTNNELIDILNSRERTYDLFQYLKSKDNFNGDWFPIAEEEKELVQTKHLTILQYLISGHNFENRQGTLFDIYDFSIIPIEFISNVYESFIGTENQSTSGSYYTPTFLVDYILHHTIDAYFQLHPNEYNCKVLDPACGSGIFLVETLRKLVAQYENVTDKKISQDVLINLVKNNLFAIDKDQDAVLIAIFSIYLTMLDYQEPKDIEKFTFPNLRESNFFTNDFFDTSASFNQIFQINKPNFIIGNPPYRRGGGKGDLINTYIQSREKLEQSIIGYSNVEIAQLFLIRVSDFCDKKTQISFIVNSKIFYNSNSKGFRQYFLNNFLISHILELSSVRHEVFVSANTPVAVLTYKYTDSLSKNTAHHIDYISLKPNPFFSKLKMLLLSKNDYKRVQQSKLIDHDYMWKILVYGSYLDFNLIKTLKESYSTLNDAIKHKAQGIIVGKNGKHSVKQYIGEPQIITEQIAPFYICETDQKWKTEFVHRDRKTNKEIFEAPSLLISKGVNKSAEVRAGILHSDAIFTDSITAVKSENIDNLYNMLGLLYSDFMKYYLFNTASSIGIEREQIHNVEKFSVPYIFDQDIVETVKNLEEYQHENIQNLDSQHRNLFNCTASTPKISYSELISNLNKSVYEKFNFSDEELSLIDYSINIMMPWIMEKKHFNIYKKMEHNDQVIHDYISIFSTHYTQIYKELGKFFQAQVFYNKNAIGIYFKILDVKPKTAIEWHDTPNIQNFLHLSSYKAMNNLFIQKDIKGFEEDGFYVIKPNEYKLWHKAIGYLDFHELRNAILRTEKQYV